MIFRRGFRKRVISSHNSGRGYVGFMERMMSSRSLGQGFGVEDNEQ